MMKSTEVLKQIQGMVCVLLLVLVTRVSFATTYLKHISGNEKFFIAD